MKRGIAALALLSMTGCTRTLYEAHFAPPAHIEKIAEAGTRSPFVKVHMTDGRVFVLERWAVEEGTSTVSGFGLEYTANRERVGAARNVTLGFADVALLETNRPYNIDVGTGSIIGMIIGTSASLSLTFVCFGLGRTCY